MNVKPEVKYWVGGLAAQVALVTAWPRLDYLMRWPSRLGLRGLVAYVAYRILFSVALRYYVMPAMQRLDERQRQQREELTALLGREPHHRRVHGALPPRRLTEEPRFDPRAASTACHTMAGATAPCA